MRFLFTHQNCYDNTPTSVVKTSPVQFENSVTAVLTTRLPSRTFQPVLFRKLCKIEHPVTFQAGPRSLPESVEIDQNTSQTGVYTQTHKYPGTPSAPVVRRRCITLPILSAGFHTQARGSRQRPTGLQAPIPEYQPSNIPKVLHVYGLTGSEAWHDHAAHGTLSCVAYGFRRGVG